MAVRRNIRQRNQSSSSQVRRGVLSVDRWWQDPDEALVSQRSNTTDPLVCSRATPSSTARASPKYVTYPHSPDDRRLNVLSQALKKFEKTTRIPCAKAYNVKLNASYFEKSTRLDELIRETEDAFANVFEHGDRKKALERLRALGSKEMHHFTAWRSGLLTGISIPLLLEGLVKSESPGAGGGKATVILIYLTLCRLASFDSA